MKKLVLFLIAMTFPVMLFAQMPSEQYILWKVWADDSTALKNLGYGDYMFSDRDTVILMGSDTDTVLFNIAHPRGYFNVWIIADTANFKVGDTDYDHSIGETDSLTLTYRPKLRSDIDTGNSDTNLSTLNNLDWSAENGYYESITPPLAEYLEFYISHTGAGDTSAVIIEIQWQ
ncbi:MAG: hypothetical protein HQ591_02840 [candidate division Zixibacteria bacterium]|nr:hypothetical protein [Candidatus Tariuqbacter arcticus]